MKLLLVICAFVACASAATVLKITTHLDVTKELVSSSVDNPLDFLDSNEIEQLATIDRDNELSKKRPVNLCHLCHQIVGFVIHHTHNRTSNQSIARTLKNVCNHVHRQRQTCQTFVGNYSIPITKMIIANKTSCQICNQLGSCKRNADDEIDQVFNTPQQTHLVLNKEGNEDELNTILQSKEDNEDEVDYSQINTGGVKPDYEFHENRVGNDDTNDSDINDQFQVNYIELPENNENENELDTMFQSEEDDLNEGQLCKICKVVVTSVLSKTTAKSSKENIKKVLDTSCRHVIPILKEKCKLLLKGFEKEIVIGIYKKHTSKYVCTIDLKNMCTVNQFDDVDINDDY